MRRYAIKPALRDFASVCCGLDSLSRRACRKLKLKKKWRIELIQQQPDLC